MAFLNRWFRNILYFPLTRMILAFIAVAVSVALQSKFLERIGEWLDLWQQPWFTVVRGMILIATAWLVYGGYVRLLEHRPVVELSRKRAWVEFAAGAVAGFGLFAATIACLWSGGFYRVEGLGQLPSLGTLMGLGLAASFVEEILIRGVVFRITEESLCTWLATVISGLLFGFLHLLNPNATWIAAVCIAVEAGGLLAAAYVTTRRLWLPIGMHFAWNFTQGGVFGVPVSGAPVSGMLRSTLTGPDLVSGGAFGAEASIFAVLICSCMTVVLMGLAARDGHIVVPFWARGSTEAIRGIVPGPTGDIALNP